MATPLSEDLRIRIIQAVEGGMSRRAAAERFGVSPSSSVRFVSEWRQRRATPGRTRRNRSTRQNAKRCGPCPKHIKFVTELPMTGVGKVDKKVLKAGFWLLGRARPDGRIAN